MRRTLGLPGHPLFAALLLLLGAVTLGSFLFDGPLGWASGILYIVYDTCLLAFVVGQTRRLLRGEPASGGPPVPFAGRPRLAVLVPARNEASVLPLCLDALLAQADPPDEIWVVDDGSTDGTGALLKARYPGVRAWTKLHSGKARSLNEVWPRAGADVIVTIDADTILEPGAIAAVRRAFASDRRLAAACGVLEPRCRGALSGPVFELFQTFEYIRAFLARLAWMQKGALLLVSGAFAAYRKDALEDLGGYDPASLVEDYDLIHRLHRRACEAGRPLSVRVIADARAVTDAPNGVPSFLKQRQRWFSGFLQTQFKNSDMVGNPRYGAVGTFMLPIKTADMLQPLYGLVAFAVLLSLLARGRGPSAFVWWFIGAKLTLDLVFHFWSVQLYYRWQGRRVPAAVWARAALATIVEPASFQLLRHAGALIGWLGYLRGANDWAPQRETEPKAVLESPR